MLLYGLCLLTVIGVLNGHPNLLFPASHPSPIFPNQMPFISSGTTAVPSAISIYRAYNIIRKVKANLFQNAGFNAPRTWSVTSRPLPSARHISIVIHLSGKCIKLGRLTSMLMPFGQFFIHDVVPTPMKKDEEDKIDCCSQKYAHHRNCFSFKISPNDPQFGNKVRMPITRSVAAPTSHNNTGVKETFNELTAFLDASNVYGSTVPIERRQKR